MRPKMLIIAGVAVAAIAVAGCGDNGSGLDKQTFRLTEKDSDNFGFVDNPPKTKVGRQGPEKMSGGDQVYFTSNLQRDGKGVGKLLAHCLVADAGNGRFDDADLDCQATMTIGDDRLFAHVGGKVFASGNITGAITGGTGAYAGATGEFSSKEKDDSTSSDSFTIWLPKS